MLPFYEKKENGVQIGMLGFTFPPHLHTHVEIAYAFSGPVNIQIDGVEYALASGDAAIAFPGHVHAYPGGKEGLGIMLIFPPEISPDYGRVLLTARPESPILSARDAHPDISAMMRGIREERQGAQDEAVLHAYIQVILARMLPALKLRRAEHDSESDAVYRAMRYLGKNFDQPVTLETLARALGMNRFSLSHLFSQRLGCNFCTYVNTLRVERARLLLTSSAASITQICYECGFENQRTFNRAFQSICGMTPTQFRNKAKGRSKPQLLPAHGEACHNGECAAFPEQVEALHSPS